MSRFTHSFLTIPLLGLLLFRAMEMRGVLSIAAHGWARCGRADSGSPGDGGPQGGFGRIGQGDERRGRHNNKTSDDSRENSLNDEYPWQILWRALPIHWILPSPQFPPEYPVSTHSHDFFLAHSYNAENSEIGRNFRRLKSTKYYLSLPVPGAIPTRESQSEKLKYGPANMSTLRSVRPRR